MGETHAEFLWKQSIFGSEVIYNQLLSEGYAVIRNLSFNENRERYIQTKRPQDDSNDTGGIFVTL